MKARLSLLAGVVLATAACGEKAPSGPPGAALYEQLNCRVCHMVAGAGGRGGPDLTYVGFRHSQAWLEAFLKDPKAWRPETMMPDPHLSPGSIKNLADYLVSLKGQDYAASPPWDAPELRGDPKKRGHFLYARVGCIACHGKGGSGGYPNNNVAGGKIPALNGVSDTYTKDELKKKIRSGSKPVKANPAGAEPLVEMPAWGTVLKDDELDAVSDYLLSLKPGTAPASDW
jgi:mono/diheme cytochrome c family protein